MVVMERETLLASNLSPQHRLIQQRQERMGRRLLSRLLSCRPRMELKQVTEAQATAEPLEQATQVQEGAPHLTEAVGMEAMERVPQALMATAGLDLQGVMAASVLDLQEVTVPMELDLQEGMAATELDLQGVMAPMGLDIQEGMAGRVLATVGTVRQRHSQVTALQALSGRASAPLAMANQWEAHRLRPCGKGARQWEVTSSLDMARVATEVTTLSLVMATMGTTAERKKPRCVADFFSCSQCGARPRRSAE